jgi:tripartite-type tricarboxylate transporter receptor subunit TctC
LLDQTRPRAGGGAERAAGATGAGGGLARPSAALRRACRAGWSTSIGPGGVGSTPYLATELFKSMTGVDVVHVPDKGGAPDLPSMAEAGVAGDEMIGWNGVLVASGTSLRIVDRLAGELRAVIGTPEAKTQRAKLGAEPAGSLPPPKTGEGITPRRR